MIYLVKVVVMVIVVLTDGVLDMRKGGKRVKTERGRGGEKKEGKKRT